MGITPGSTIHVDNFTSLTLIPRSILALDSGASTSNVNSNTTLRIGMIEIKRRILVNKISVNALTVGTSGTYKIALFSEDGQTKIFQVTTGTISSGGIKTTSLASETQVDPGNYYIAILSVSTAASTFDFQDVDGADWSVTGEPIIEGFQIVTADTIPATISPTGFTYQNTNTISIRLDN